MPGKKDKQSKKTKSRSQSKEADADRDKSGEGYVPNTITNQKADEEMSDGGSDIEINGNDPKNLEELKNNEA